MASETGREAIDIIAQMKAEPQHYTLGQALRMLGFSQSCTVQEWGAFIQENVHIRPWLSLAFPASSLLELKENEGLPRFSLTATLFGLYSTMGPLPTFYTEELLDEARADESVSRDFLDILNNHLYHLLYAAEHHNQLERRTLESRNPSAADIQFSLIGQATPVLRRHALPPAVLAELLISHSRSALQLERYLSRVLGRDDVRVEQCVERRVTIAPRQRSRLGSVNTVLGEDVVLGCQIRDSTGKFRVHLYAVEDEDMHNFLPGSAGYRLLVEYIHRYLNTSLEYDLVLHPVDKPTPPHALGTQDCLGCYIGAPAVRRPVTVFWSETASLNP